MITSEGGGITIMDFNTAVALYETADDLDVLRDLPRSLLVKLYSHINGGTEMGSLKHQSKMALIKKLGDSVRYYLLCLNLNALTFERRGNRRGLWTMRGI